MAEKLMRLSQVARKLNVGISTITEFLASKGVEIEAKPNTKIDNDQYNLLVEEFASSLKSKMEADELNIGTEHKENVVLDSNSIPESGSQEDEVKIKNLSAEVNSEEEPEEKISAKAEKLPGLTIVQEAPKEEEKEEIPEVEETPVEVEETPEVEKPKEEAPTPAEDKIETKSTKLPGLKVVGKMDIEEPKPAKPKKKEPVAKVEPKQETPAPEPVKEEPKKEEKVAAETPKETKPKEVKVKKEEKVEEKREVITAKADKLQGLTVLDKIELPQERKPKPVASSSDDASKKKKRKRKKIGVDGKLVEPVKFDPRNKRGKKGKKDEPKEEISKKEIQDKLNETLSKIAGASKGKTVNRAKYRKEKRAQVAEAEQQRLEQEELESKILKVTEFISANELASLMDVSVNEVISTCMTMGMFVSINQRLDAESITIIADEFNFEVEFISAEDDSTDVDEIVDSEEDLIERPPIVTIMGHVDHGKTSLLDYIRTSNITDKEAGGITQHIGAYSVKTDSGKFVSFLDTPGHEAFTAMRARGAQLTDIVVIVVAADDSVMPQTKEALNHAKAAGVPIIIAINKIDKENANPDKIREALSQENILVEDWGGKYQCQELSAKTGQGIDDLLEKILLEAEMLELKANPDRHAMGTVVEASLDKGRGYVTTVLVQKGTLSIGDIMLAGSHFGKVKAMTDHSGKRLKTAGPSVPVQILGLNGAPQAGDSFVIKTLEREAREIATNRSQIQREQSFRTKKHVTLEEIGRRLAIGNFKELNLIIKGDVDGSVEALSDSLEKLKTEEVGVNVLSKGVGQISESDVLLATASDAIIIGFQVRPSVAAKKLAETEQIDIQLYSVIYAAIDEIKSAIEGMHEPDTKEEIVGNAEIRETFKISKVGTIAGCMVIDGFMKRANRIRIIREGIVTYEGELSTLKRYKEDVQEVKKGFECGLGIKGFNDLKIGDVVESYEIVEIKKKL